MATNDWDWLSQLMPNYGASSPYGPGGAPQPGGAFMPGGGARFPGATPGAPSMGYPALNPANAPPASQPPPQQGGAGAAPWFSIGWPNFRNIINGPPAVNPSLGHIGWPGGPSAGVPPVNSAQMGGDTGGYIPRLPQFNMPPVNSAQFGGDTGGVPVGSPSAAPAPQPFTPPHRPVSHPYSLPFESGFPDPTAAPPPAAAPPFRPPARPVTPSPPTAYPPGTPGAPPRPAAPVTPNLGYYRPSVGNARGATFVPAGAGATAPPIWRGALAQGPGKDYYGGFFG